MSAQDEDRAGVWSGRLAYLTAAVGLVVLAVVLVTIGLAMVGESL